MFSLLNQPYPVNNESILQFRRAILIGLFVGLFLLAFQPFGISEWETPYKTLKVLGFGAITFVITLLSFVSWPRLFPHLFAEKSWTVGHEILVITINVLLIAVVNRLYLQGLMGPGQESGLGWTEMIVVTFLISIFPITGLVLLNYITQLKKYVQSAAELPVHTHFSDNPRTENVKVKPKESIRPVITLIADNDKDKLVLTADELFCIESSDNYCTVFYLKNGQLAKLLLRSSLSRMEKQIAQPHIVRCHRSFIVNLNHVERVTGNAQGYKLHLMEGQLQIPVARQYNETLIAELKAL